MLDTETLRNNIRENLIDMRNAHNLTQEDVGKLVDKKFTTVASWEQGKSLPDLQTLYRLSLYYKKSMEYFYENDPKQKNTPPEE